MNIYRENWAMERLSNLNKLIQYETTESEFKLRLISESVLQLKGYAALIDSHL